MKYLSRLLGNDKSHKLFLQKYFSRLPFSLPGGAKDFLNHLDWDIIENDLINRQKAYLQTKRDRISAEASWEQTQGKGVFQ